MTLRYGSVCSGVGTCRLASAPHGWECEFFAEIDPFASAVLAHHYPAVPNLGDFTSFDWNAWRGLDVIVGGPPCQAFSVAGNRESLDDERGNLTLRFVEMIHAIEPRFVVYENVPGLLSTRDNAFGCLLGALVGADAALIPERGQRWTDAGMVAGPRRVAMWRVLDAQHYGVPQRRRRIFLVGVHPRDIGFASLFFESDRMQGNPTTRREARERSAADVAGCLGGGSGQRGWAPDTDRMTFVPEVAPCLTRRDQKGPDSDVTSVALIAGECADTLSVGANQTTGFLGDCVGVVTHSLRADGFDASEDGTGRGTPLVPVAYQCQGSNVGPMGTIRAGNGNETGGVPFVACDPVSVGTTLTGNGDAHSGFRDDGGLVPVAFDTTQITSRENRCNPQVGDTGHPLAAEAHPPAIVFNPQAAGKQTTLGANEIATSSLVANQTPAVAVSLRGREGGATAELGGEVSSALRASQGGGDKPHALTGMMVRRLTPRECERLMNYPDDWTLVPYRGKPAADGPRYRAIGNGWAQPVVEWVFGRITEYMEASR